MYLAVATMALVGLFGRRDKAVLATLIGLGTVGTLFAGGLTIYEFFVLKLTFTGLPACVYGLALYAGILGTSIWARRSHTELIIPPISR